MSKAQRTFLLDGMEYEYVDVSADHTGQTVRRFTYGQEPQVIATVPWRAVEASDPRVCHILVAKGR
ncbi:hypothetical protein [Arthrobacter sp. ISL-65]|uniref:hypothetical protein n=1 Tax=Arthrobacter sp. ISL-65 TaxID=2819112 RepID=UPI001BEB82BA|nr:hypothetical protein [Arthrobacter sp. ISL-65]MBT2548053.1 hypothetical protein [Arthrobacter sp. ISL-65]